MTTRRTFLQTTGLALLGLALAPSSLLAAGEPLHIVRSGESLSAIAARYGVTVAAIKVRNQLKGDTIVSGQRLWIPAAGSSRPAAAPVSPLAGVIAATSGLRIARGRWTHVVAHHSGIERGDAKAYDGAHRRRGMENGLAYHFVIGNGRDSGDGEIEVGPRWHKQLQGGHVRSEHYNEHGIGICMVGNFEKRRPSAKQMDSFTALVDWLRDDAPLGVTPKFTVHRWVDKNHTVCPGRLFPYAAMKKRYGAA